MLALPQNPLAPAQDPLATAASVVLSQVGLWNVWGALKTFRN
ncbi:hypothetical protein [Caenimonas koreensis]